MGTRNLICVFADGEYKVAQYGQWDGYPSGQGAGILEFLRGVGNIKKLKDKLPAVRFVDGEKDKEFIDAYEAAAPEWSSDPDNRTPEQKRWFKTYVSRNLGSEILTNIANSDDTEILLRNSINFAGDSLFCEYAYVVDLDKETFEVFEGCNKEPIAGTERFAFTPVDNPDHRDTQYYQVRHVHTFQLSDLPSRDEFVSILEPDDSEH